MSDKLPIDPWKHEKVLVTKDNRFNEPLILHFNREVDSWREMIREHNESLVASQHETRAVQLSFNIE
jgi:hypothetical protein